MTKYVTQPKPLPKGAIELSNRNTTKEEFAKSLYQKMTNKGWNQSQLARYSGLNRDAISTYVRARSTPSPENLTKLSNALGCKPEELMANYFEAAAAEQPSKLELKEVHGEEGYMWLKVNMRVTKDVAAKVFWMLNEQPSSNK